MTRNRGHAVAPHPDCVEFKFSLFMHTEKVTTAPSQGIEQVDVRVIIARAKPKGKWHLDCLDCGQYDVFNARAPEGLVLEGTIKAISERGFDPAEIVGWTNWFNSGTVQRQVNDMLRKYSHSRATA